MQKEEYGVMYWEENNMMADDEIVDVEDMMDMMGGMVLGDMFMAGRDNNGTYFIRENDMRMAHM